MTAAAVPAVVALAVAAASLSVVREAAAHGRSPICDTGDVSQFADVGVYDYGADYIWCAKVLGLTAGKGDDTFGPGESLTRAHLAVVVARLWRDALDYDCPEVGHSFRDVARGHWARGEIACLHALGLTDGMSWAFYRPTKVLTVSWLTRFVARMLNQAPHRACEMTGGDEVKRAAACLVRLNIAPSSSEASSSSPATRAQMAVYLVGAWHHMIGGGQPPEPPAVDDSDGGQPGDDAAAVGPTVEDGSRHLMTFERAMSIAERLASDIKSPAPCGRLPLDNTILMPNAKRAYRFGVHQGVDFICRRGQPVLAALDGRAVVAVGDYEDATSGEHEAVLDIARTLRATPAYTLVMLYGNYVVIDHGVIDDVGHVITIYAHLEAVDSAVRPGRQVKAGDSVGRVGNSGTTGAAAGHRNQNVHIHWELHVDGQFLGAGLSTRDTRAVYQALFEGHSG